MRWLFFLFNLIFLSGCWDSIELDESIMVVGVGISKHENGEYQIILEALAPSTISPVETTEKEKRILIETTGATLLDAARETIRIAKRRLFFTHTEVWVIHDEIAKEEDMLKFFDVLRREKMLRLNSYIFVSEVPPMEIFTTDFTFSHILSEELVSSVKYSKYVSDYPEVLARNYMRMMLSPLKTGYLPIITTIQKGGEKLSILMGSAVFKEGRMVGKLNTRESFGLMWLNDQVNEGNITINFDGERASFKLVRGKRDLQASLQGKELKVHIEVSAEGGLADQIIDVKTMNEWLQTFEGLVSRQIKQDIKQALKKLQKDFHTDASSIGIHVYREQVHDFNKVKKNWDEIFANATISIDVETKITDKGLIESPGYRFQKREYDQLYRFKKDD